jgi:hypothetical protein
MQGDLVKKLNYHMDSVKNYDPDRMELDIEHEKINEDHLVGKMEDIRISSAAYRQIRIGEFVSVVFTLVGILSSIISSEVQFYMRADWELIKDDAKSLNYVSMASTLILAISLIANAQMWIRWKVHKHVFNSKDTIFNTGMYKTIMAEILILLVQPYPFLDGVKYKEYNNGCNSYSPENVN